jgi:hypothetical protein
MNWKQRKLNESSEAKTRRLLRCKQRYYINKERYRSNAKLWREQNKQYIQKYAKTWRMNHNGKWMRLRRLGYRGPYTKIDGKDWRKKNREHYLRLKRDNDKKNRKNAFIEALTHYTNGKPKCYCCSEDIIILLSLDHINGGGRQHRKKAKIKHTAQWAKRHNWPKIFRVACHSCNLGAYINGGICPHNTAN